LSGAGRLAGGRRYPLEALAATTAGTGPPLLLIHALGANRRIWEPLFPHLAGRRRLIAVDLPGFGDSPPLPEPPTPRAFARLLADYLDRLGIAQAGLVGSSLGGWIAFELALLGRARSVTALAPAGLWPRRLAPRADISRRLARPLAPLLRAAAATASGRRLLLSGVLANPTQLSPQAAANLIAAYLTAPDYGRANAAMRASRFERLAELAVPVTLVWGERDRLVAPPKRLPDGVHSVILAEAGHLLPLDRPAKVAALILRTDRLLGA